MQLLQSADVLLPFGFSEFHEQHRSRIATHEGRDGRTKQRDVTREFDHGLIDKLDCDRVKLDDVLSRLHRGVEASEMTRADGTAAEHGGELELDAGRECERAFGADQDMRKVEVVSS